MQTLDALLRIEELLIKYGEAWMLTKSDGTTTVLSPDQVKLTPETPAVATTKTEAKVGARRGR